MVKVRGYGSVLVRAELLRTELVLGLGLRAIANVMVSFFLGGGLRLRLGLEFRFRVIGAR